MDMDLVEAGSVGGAHHKLCDVKERDPEGLERISVDSVEDIYRIYKVASQIILV